MAGAAGKHGGLQGAPQGPGRRAWPPCAVPTVCDPSMITNLTPGPCALAFLGCRGPWAAQRDGPALGTGGPTEASPWTPEWLPMPSGMTLMQVLAGIVPRGALAHAQLVAAPTQTHSQEGVTEPG